MSGQSAVILKLPNIPECLYVGIYETYLHGTCIWILTATRPGHIPTYLCIGMYVCTMRKCWHSSTRGWYVLGNVCIWVYKHVSFLYRGRAVRFGGHLSWRCSRPISLILAGERLCSVGGSFLEMPDCVRLVRGQLAISRTKDPWHFIGGMNFQFLIDLAYLWVRSIEFDISIDRYCVLASLSFHVLSRLPSLLCTYVVVVISTST